MRVEILESTFDPWKEIAQFESSIPRGKQGATAVFVGTMRDFNEGDTVVELELEHYEGMTDRHLSFLAESLSSQHNLADVMVLHRVGRIFPGDPIVLVAVWSAHRAAAFQACSAIVEDLKSKAPFWKKELLKDGQLRWVEHNTEGPGMTLNQ